ncbi:MAG: VTT domain-containing protein, partial [Candidatus Dormibacteraeota bacterium]|nr:VTT domain-containing protein [Candidatus Dormibacteraeota bacterium]
MDLINGLYGELGILVLCGIILANEAGVPLFINCELLLITSGILINTGAFEPWLFVPLALVATAGGAVTGYSWARLVGDTGLQRVAERIGQGERIAKLRNRFGKASPLRIALFRITPGLRVYTSLVAGAVGISRRRFLTGVIPVIVVWVAVYTLLGYLVGVPVTRYLDKIQSIVLSGALLIGVGIAAYFVIRRIPAAGRAPLARLPNRLRVVLAVAVDVALLVTVVSGALDIIGGILSIAAPLIPVDDVAWWVELLVVVLVIAVFYSVATRRGVRATAGETLFDASYLTGRGRGQGQAGVKRQVELDQEAAPPDELVKVSAAFRTLADTRRLQVVRLLLQRDASQTEVSHALSLTQDNAAEVLHNLEDAGLAIG